MPFFVTVGVVVGTDARGDVGHIHLIIRAVVPVLIQPAVCDGVVEVVSGGIRGRNVSPGAHRNSRRRRRMRLRRRCRKSRNHERRRKRRRRRRRRHGSTRSHHHLIGGPYGPGKNFNDSGAAPTRLVGEGDMRRHHSSGFVRASPL